MWGIDLAHFLRYDDTGYTLGMLKTRRVRITGLLLLPVCLAVVFSVVTAPKRAVCAAVDRHINKTRLQDERLIDQLKLTPAQREANQYRGYTVNEIKWMNRNKAVVNVTMYTQQNKRILILLAFKDNSGKWQTAPASPLDVSRSGQK